jgi:hypothetical protein
MSSELMIGNRVVENVFQLLGKHEDDISAAIAWSLHSSVHLMTALLTHSTGSKQTDADVIVHVHRHESDHGITDIELYAHDKFHLLIEAKQGWIVPALEQLEKYVSRRSFNASSSPVKKMITLSAASEQYAKKRLGVSKIGGIPLQHISWSTLLDLIEAASILSGNKEKAVLRQLKEYLKMNMGSQRLDSNWAYVVALASGTPNGWSTSWIDVVVKHGKYFHPVGSGWPKEPPTYIAFRYSGKLQSVHFIAKWEIIDDLSSACPGIPESPVEAHFLYTLGPAIIPVRTIRTGRLFRNGRVWAAIDTLLTSDTISSARDETQKRIGAV